MGYQLGSIGVTLLVCVGVVAVFLLWKRLQNFIEIKRSLSKHWQGPPGHWLWGHVVNSSEKEDLMMYFHKHVRNYPYGFKADVGPFYSYLRVHHPDAARKILSGSADMFPKDEQQYKPMVPWLGYGLLILNGKEWFRHRRLLTSSFHFDILRPYVDIMNTSAKILLGKWKRLLAGRKQITLEIFKDSSLLALDSMLQCLMSFDSQCQMEDSSSEHYGYVSSILKLSRIVVNKSRSWNPFYYSKLTSTGREFSRVCRIVHQYSESVIRKRRDEITKGSKENTQKQRQNLDFLDMLLLAQDEEGGKLSNEEIRAEVDTFMFEGHDTTASAIAWSLYMMAKNKEHQDKCYEEIVAVVGDKEDVDWQSLSKLPYLTMCVKESLRIYPPVPAIPRRTNIDIEVNGKVIKKGTTVLLSILGIHRNPLVWPDPDEFIPSRFSADNARGRSPYAHVPFAAGPRNCIGQNFAMNEVKVSLAQILRQFEISVDETREIVECSKITYGTRTGLYLNISRRSENVGNNYA